MSKSSTLFVGMNVHKETIDVAITTNRLSGNVQTLRSDHESYGCHLAKLKREATTLKSAYEAGLCGFALYRLLPEKTLM
jgi:transposase